MKSRSKVTEQEIQRIKDLAKEGLNISRIAATIDRDRSTFAENTGYTVLCIKEEDIEEHPESVIQLVQELLKKCIIKYYKWFPKTL